MDRPDEIICWLCKPDGILANESEQYISITTIHFGKKLDRILVRLRGIFGKTISEVGEWQQDRGMR
jgi:hypothetical protein